MLAIETEQKLYKLVPRIYALQGFIETKASLSKVKFRAISVDLNGNKTTANEYSSVICIPKNLRGGSRKKAVAGAEAIAEIFAEAISRGSAEGSPIKAVVDLEKDTPAEGVQEEVYREICKKYGDR